MTVIFNFMLYFPHYMDERTAILGKNPFLIYLIGSSAQ